MKAPLLTLSQYSGNKNPLDGYGKWGSEDSHGEGDQEPDVPGSGTVGAVGGLRRGRRWSRLDAHADNNHAGGYRAAGSHRAGPDRDQPDRVADRDDDQRV
jgi:hypothetical protein